MLKYDPVEDTPEYIEAMKEIQPELDALPEWASPDGIWERKRQLLAERRIQWRNPKEMNPEVIIN